MRSAALPLHAALLSAAVLVAGCDATPEVRHVARPGGAAASAQPLPVPSGEALAGRLGCGACHIGAPIDLAAAPLGDADPALDPVAVYAYLLDPPEPAPGAARMPDFRLSETEAAALALDIAGGRPGSGSDASDARAFRAVVRAWPMVADGATGRRIRVALRCDACHGGPPSPAAPPLQHAAARLQPLWLRAFLERPHPVRPLGWRPGSGTRMPSFGLTSREIDSLVAWLAPRAVERDTANVRSLTKRTADNTLTLMRERWGCMGCHAWNGAGGRIGPDLAQTGQRLRSAQILGMLRDPAHSAPGTIMPRPLLQPRDVDRIVALLVHNDDTKGVWQEPLMLVDPAIHEPASGDDAAAVYDRSCALCHGRSGRGDGINAPFLAAHPAAHADEAAMSKRPDDTLYDGIAAGGRILGGTGEMPAFGGTLEPAMIRALVEHIRGLCDCAGPVWSRDGASAP